VAVPLIVVANAVAGFIYHMTSPQTKQRRAMRRAENEYQEKMAEVAKLERDLQYAESFILARQDVLDKSVALAQIKMSQDQVEREMKLSLRDQTGIHGLSTPSNHGEQNQGRLLSLRDRIKSFSAPAQDPPEPVSADAHNGHHPETAPNFP
jgi:hypothetical protein